MASTRPEEPKADLGPPTLVVRELANEHRERLEVARARDRPAVHRIEAELPNESRGDALRASVVAAIARGWLFGQHLHARS